MQLGVGAVGLRFVRRGIVDGLRNFATAGRARPGPLRFHLGAALPFGVCFRLGPRLSPSHGRLDRGQPVLPTRQLSGQCIAAAAPQDRLLRLVLLVGLGY